MKYNVRLTYAVEVCVEADSEEAVEEWMNRTTPMAAQRYAKTNLKEEYSEEYYPARDDAAVDCVIGKGLLSAGIIKQDEVISKAEPTVLKENNMVFSMVEVDFPSHSLERIEEKLARVEKKLAEEYVDLPCRIYLDKAPSEEYRNIAEKIDGLNFTELCFFIESVIGRDGLEDPWQKSDWKLFYIGSDGEHNLLAEGIELLPAFDFVKAGYEEMKAKTFAREDTSIDFKKPGLLSAGIIRKEPKMEAEQLAPAKRRGR